MGKKAASLIEMIKEKEIEWIDLRFTDPKGKWQHLTMVSSVVDEDMLTDGFMFDGSSIEGWKAINESDMILMPDLDATYIDPFSATPMLILVCDIVEPSTGAALCPRSAFDRQARRSLSEGQRHRRHRLHRPGSRILRLRRCALRPRLRRRLLPPRRHRAADATPAANMTSATWATARAPRAAISRSRRSTAAVDLRGEMVSTMLEMGLPCDKHHHEVAAAQHELGLTFGTLVDHRRPHAGLQVRRAPGGARLWQDRDVHAQADQGRQRQRHAHALVDLERQDAAVRRRRLCRAVAKWRCSSSAASSSTPRPATPSPTRRPTATSAWSRVSKRRCCSPIRRATARPRAASPMAAGGKAKRVEVRFPDAMANPYLCLHRAADGRPRWHREPHPPGRADGQEPL